MKIATWNINSIRTRITHLREFLREENPDIMLLQETKCEDSKFPNDELSDLPYNIYIHGQKSYNGVAILSKFRIDEIKSDFPNNICSNQARFLEISCQISGLGFCRIICLYAPNGGDVGSDKFEMKLKFYDGFNEYIRSIKSFDTKIIIGGDLNIAPFDIDVYSPDALKNSTCFTDLEKQKFRSLLNMGFDDLYRIFNPKKQEFSWWDYRGGSFQKDQGLRIDFLLTSNNMSSDFQSCYIARQTRTKERPSDHAPIVAF